MEMMMAKPAAGSGDEIFGGSEIPISGGTEFPVVDSSDSFFERCVDRALFRIPRCADPKFIVNLEGLAHDDDEEDATYTTLPDSIVTAPPFLIFANEALKAYHDYFGSEPQYKFKSFKKVVTQKNGGEYYLTCNVKKRGSEDYETMQAVVRCFWPFLSIFYVNIIT